MKLHVHVLYEVKQGDCLSTIAEKFGMPLIELARLNTGNLYYVETKKGASKEVEFFQGS